MLIAYLRNIRKDSLIKNSIALITTNFMGITLGFFFWIIATRYYSPYDVGMVSAILSSISIISMISQAGFPIALIYNLSLYKENGEDIANINRIINSCMTITIILSIFLVIIFMLGLKFWNEKLESILDLTKGFEFFVVFLIIAIADALSSIMTGTFAAGKVSSYSVIKELSFDITKILPIIILQFGIIGILMSWGIGIVTSIIVGFILLHKVWKWSPRLVIDPIIKKMAKFSIANYIAGIFYNLPRFIFPILILNIISAESAGYFFIVMTVASALYGISQSISNSLLAESSKHTFKNIGKALKFNIVLLLLGILLFVIFGKFILEIFNPKYAENNIVMTMIILAVASLPLSLNNIFTTVRNTQKRVDSVIKVNGAVSILSIILSIPLMEMMGIEGVALSYLIANTIVAITIIFNIDIQLSLSLLRNKSPI